MRFLLSSATSLGTWGVIWLEETKTLGSSVWPTRRDNRASTFLEKSQVIEAEICAQDWDLGVWTALEKELKRVVARFRGPSS